MFRFGESSVAVLEEPIEKQDTENEILDFNRQREMEKALQRISQLSLDLFNFANDEIFGLYFWESAYDKGIERDFYKDLISDSLKEGFEHDFERALSKKQYQLESKEQGADSIEKAGLMTYENLWERYGIDPQIIIKKYADFIEEHMIGGISPYADYTTEERENKSKRNSNKKAWEKWGINTDKVEKWIKKQNALKSTEITSREKFAELFALDVPPEAAQKIFEKYLEILSLGNSIGQLFKDEKSISKEKSININLSIIEKATHFLSDLSGQASSADAGTIFRELENSRTEMMLLSSAARVLRESDKNFNYEQFKTLKIEKLEVKDGVAGEKCLLDEDTKKQAKKMMEKAYWKIFTDKDGTFNQSAYDRVIGEFDYYMETPGAMDGEIVFVLQFQGELAGLLRFKPLKDDPGTVLAKSLVVDDETQGVALGSYFNKKVVEIMNQRFNIKAQTRVGNHSNDKYRELGYVFDPQTFTKNGVEYYNITLPKQEQLKKAA